MENLNNQELESVSGGVIAKKYLIKMPFDEFKQQVNGLISQIQDKKERCAKVEEILNAWKDGNLELVPKFKTQIDEILEQVKVE